jgi:phosphoribosylformimino-5-aminoimidazole carboxamide ribotide isomerase
MQIYPAIDLRAGQCVRLRQGDYAQETVFGADPAAMAQRWVAEGATYLHLVDLDGAKAGHPVNGPSVRAIVQASGVPCQLGGGLRTPEHVEEALSWGVERVILGTRALQSPIFLMRMANKYPRKIVLGVDARDGRIATHGWLNVSEVAAVEWTSEIAKVNQEHFGGMDLAALVYTDISRDGMMEGANVDAMAAMATAVLPLPVIASGGVTTLDDIRRLQAAGLAGCIVGRALYEGQLNLGEIAAMLAGK